MGVKISNDISHKYSCILLGRVSTKVVRRIVKFEILNFGDFFRSFLATVKHGSQWQIIQCVIFSKPLVVERN